MENYRLSRRVKCRRKTENKTVKIIGYVVDWTRIGSQVK
jgi:hypothetical protein